MTFKVFSLAALLSAAALHSSVALAFPVANPLGMSTGITSSARTIAIDLHTRNVNVKQGEVVRFTMDGREFYWWFDTFGTPTVSLSKISPMSFGPSTIMVYVTPSDQSLGI